MKNKYISQSSSIQRRELTRGTAAAAVKPKKNCLVHRLPFYAGCRSGLRNRRESEFGEHTDSDMH